MGMRVKFTLCITAAGMCAPLFFVVHCNEREVRDPSGVVVVKVPCMCIGGDVDPFSNGHGFIAFVLGSTAEDEESAMIKLRDHSRRNRGGWRGGSRRRAAVGASWRRRLGCECVEKRERPSGGRINEPKPGGL